MTDHWKQLEARHKKEGLALFLGAGVSLRSGIPTWLDLICRLMDTLPETGGKKIFNALRRAGFSLPAITEFAERKVGNEQKFVETLRECLYRDFPCRDIKRTYKKEEAKKIVEHIRSNNPTLEAVYNLAVCDTPVGLNASLRIHGIVNFNFDALMQAYDQARNAVKNVKGMHRCLRTIESPSHNRTLGRINLYHPHGYLRFDRNEGKSDKEATSRVLSEHEYFEFYNKTTEVFTYTMLYFLREYNCMFVGMSMTDDNVRRLLFYSKSERERSRKREGRDPIEKKPRHFAIMRKREEDSNLLDFTETTLAALGVSPLWVDEFDDIPERLGTLVP